MHRVLAIGLTLLLTGCGFSSGVIRSDALDFGGIIEDTTNKLLVMNVLRARDKAPLHFADIPVIRESIQTSAGISGARILGSLIVPPFGTSSITGNAPRSAGAASTSLQMTPSFEITQLNSKDFITGISSPIDPKVVKYWLDRGLDRRIAALLFFSAVEIVETRADGGAVSTIRIANNPREAAEVIRARPREFGGPADLRCDTQSDFERYLKLLNSLNHFFANSYRERRLLARGLRTGADSDPRNLQAIAALDPSKVQVVHDKDHDTYSLYSLSSDQKIAFCFYDDLQRAGSAASQYEVIESGPPAGGQRRNCFQSVVDVVAEDGERRAANPVPILFGGPAERVSASRYCGIYNRFSGLPGTREATPSKLELRLYIRSVGEIFQFLGDLLYYQDAIRAYLDANPKTPLKLNAPLTFGYCGDHPTPGCNDVFLRFDGDPCNARFFLNYRDQEYYVGNYDTPENPAADGQFSKVVGNPPTEVFCRAEHPSRKDHTLEVLAVLHQLIGLNRSASDIRPTGSVFVLP